MTKDWCIPLDAPEDVRRAVQNEARHMMILKLEADILQDMMVCKIEGWDKTEYIRMLQELLGRWKV